MKRRPLLQKKREIKNISILLGILSNKTEKITYLEPQKRRNNRNREIGKYCHIDTTNMKDFTLPIVRSSSANWDSNSFPQIKSLFSANTFCQGILVTHIMKGIKIIGKALMHSKGNKIEEQYH